MCKDLLSIGVVILTLILAPTFFILMAKWLESGENFKERMEVFKDEKKKRGKKKK